MEVERIGDDKKDRRKRERGSKGKAYIRKGESTKGAALQKVADDREERGGDAGEE